MSSCVLFKDRATIVFLKITFSRHRQFKSRNTMLHNGRLTCLYRWYMWIVNIFYFHIKFKMLNQCGSKREAQFRNLNEHIFLDTYKILKFPSNSQLSWGGLWTLWLTPKSHFWALNLLEILEKQFSSFFLSFFHSLLFLQQPLFQADFVLQYTTLGFSQI